MEKRKAISLKRYFTKSLLSLALGMIVIIAAWIALMLLAINTGIAAPANKGESEVRTEMERQRKFGSFQEDIKPDFYDYVYLGESGEVKQSSLTGSEEEKALEAYKDKGKTYFTGAWMTFSDNSSCLFVWENKAMFTNPVLRKMLPSVDVCMVVLMLSSLVLFFIVCVWSISKRFRGLLFEMETVSNQMAEKNLEDSYIRKTGIKEFDHALESLDSMRTALRTSVSHEWQKEQERREEIASLTHDIKAPLTIIRGNTELLLEDVREEEDEELLKSIAGAGARVHNYVNNLQLLSNLDIAEKVRQETTIDELIRNVTQVLIPLSDMKSVKLSVEQKGVKPMLVIDLQSVSRALINIGENAIRYTSEGGWVKFIIDQKAGNTSFTFFDEGPGFSKEALAHSKDMFWQEDKSRSSGNNYGMGLAIANHIAADYNGRLEIKNMDKGAAVKLTIIA